ncbi:hypothetical protein [Psychromonas algicola]|uniref:hypothetical protein n=1 Tax=Psychromonas algicola TaxID=2555642 RepID=UPI0010682798|nr:hypothetical protein [Psychromonas sp. RZ5]TEW49832.1 hypothetical protein E2R67_10190 [Psychromonas sp. RZ5]
MITLNKTLFVSACLFAGMSTSAMAIENITTVCSHGSNIRIVEVVYSGENNVPCEVQYTKEEGTKTLWSAANSAGYCESKAAAFVEKQKGWGWSCDTASVATKEAE